MNDVGRSIIFSSSSSPWHTFRGRGAPDEVFAFIGFQRTSIDRGKPWSISHAYSDRGEEIMIPPDLGMLEITKW